MTRGCTVPRLRQAIGNLMTRLYKPLPLREEEAANPPALRETLDFSAANRIANVITETLATLFHSATTGVDNFLQYLEHNYGDIKFEVAGERTHGNVDLLKAHIRSQAQSSFKLHCFLDYFRDYVVSYYEKNNPQWTREQMMHHPDGRTVLVGINRLNKSLEHDACIYRINLEIVFKIGSEALQEHAISPALQLLRESGMSEALKEYNDALVEWAQGKTDDAILHSSHAVESAMKFILKDMQITVKENANPSTLIDEITKSKILPESYKDFWTKLNQGLQGVITIRNKAPGAGHGPAPGAHRPDDDLAEYAVNLAGSNILFLIRRWRSVKGSSAKFDPLGTINKALSSLMRSRR